MSGSFVKLKKLFFPKVDFIEKNLEQLWVERSSQRIETGSNCQGILNS